jgi:RNA polymerase sigma-70 factor (ECF subfamily)
MIVSEKELIEAASRGDAAAFSELYRRCRDRVYDFAYRMLGGESVAEDVTHEAFLVLIEHPERYRTERGSVLTFLCAVARNHSLHHLRSHQRQAAGPIDDLVEEHDWASPDPLAGLLERELAAHVEAAIAALPPEHREVIILREYEELSYEEIAAVTDSTLNLVKVRLHRARRALAKHLERYLISDGDGHVAQSVRLRNAVK